MRSLRSLRLPYLAPSFIVLAEWLRLVKKHLGFVRLSFGAEYLHQLQIDMFEINGFFRGQLSRHVEAFAEHGLGLGQFTRDATEDGDEDAAGGSTHLRVPLRELRPGLAQLLAEAPAHGLGDVHGRLRDRARLRRDVRRRTPGG